MAKKSKRKVSTGTGPGSIVAEAPVAPVRPANGTSVARPVASPYSTTGRRSPVLTTEFNPDYSYVLNDLKRIGILAGSFLVILIILSFIL